NARGSGIPQTKTALFLRDGYISLRTVVGKFSLCSVSLASGIALGREGPAVQVGAGVASVLGRKLGLSANSVKALVPAGASAALAAAVFSGDAEMHAMVATRGGGPDGRRARLVFSQRDRRRLWRGGPGAQRPPNGRRHGAAGAAAGGGHGHVLCLRQCGRNFW